MTLSSQQTVVYLITQTWKNRGTRKPYRGCGTKATRGRDDLSPNGYRVVAVGRWVGGSEKREEEVVVVVVVCVFFAPAIQRETSEKTSCEMVRLVFCTKPRAKRTICTSVSPRASTRVSPDFALLRLRSPSFKSKNSFLKHFQDHWRLQMHTSKHSLSLRLLHA